MSATARRDEPQAAQPSALGAVDDARLQLTWRLADVLSLPDGRTTANDRAMTADMLSAVLAATEPDLRARIAGRLSVATGLPPALTRQLALDIAPVARAVLEGMAEVPDAILAEAAGVSPEHRQMLVRREGMSSAVAEAILRTGDTATCAAVLGQESVTLSAARIETLVQRALEEQALRRPLLDRAELRPAQGFVMFWWCGAPERRRILARFSMDRTVLQDTLQPLFPVVFTDEDPDPLVKRLLRLIDRRHRPRGANGEVVTPEVLERTLMVARATPDAELCHAVGLLAGVATDTATRVLHDEGGEPFAVLAKSAGLSRAAFERVLDGAAGLAAEDAPGHSEARREALMATFDTVARDYARAVLQYWDWRPDTSAGAPVPASAPLLPDAPDEGGYLGAV